MRPRQGVQIDVSPGENDADTFVADVRALGANTGRLIANDADYDPYSGQPRMSNVPVNVIPARVAAPI